MGVAEAAMLLVVALQQQGLGLGAPLGVGFTLVNEWALERGQPSVRPVILADVPRPKARPGTDFPPDAA